ncbi:hypothetical protein Tco_0813115 [Tanacetum coccineum]
MKTGPSYDLNNLFEVQDHDAFVDHMDEYHEVHEMQNDVQHNYVVDSDADYTSDSNIIPYDQYLLTASFREVKKWKKFLFVDSTAVDVEKSRCLDLEADMYNEAPDFNSFFKIKNLKHQIQEKRYVIRPLEDLVANENDRSQLYDSIKITRTHTSEKTSTMLNEIESLKAQLRSKEPCFTSDYVKPKVLAPGMYAIDIKPIPHPLKNNRSAHLNSLSAFLWRL